MTGEEVAIKVESNSVKYPQLPIEAEAYKKLAGGVGVPSMLWYGKEADYTAIVMDLL